VRYGFLISRFSDEELTHIIDSGGKLYCSITDGRLLAYLLESSLTEFTALFEDGDKGRYNAKQSINGTERYLYQIATSLKEGRTGLGTQLLNSFLRSDPLPVITDVLISPVNNLPSLNFFHRNGFTDSGILELPEYRSFGTLTSQVLTWKP
jgi:ribosomal protein S18 acetylase RimI-like enzyme